MPTEETRPNQLRRAISLLRTGIIPMTLRFYDQATRKRTGVPLWRLSRITDQVYCGGQHYPPGWQAMRREGITAVLNMREAEYDDSVLGIGGERHLHLPTPDNTPVALEDLERAADFIAEEVKNGGKVYVHCGVGVGRAPSAVAAYFIKHKGLSAKEAIYTIRGVRPFVHLTGKQGKQLFLYEQRLKQEEQQPRPS